MGGSRRSRGVPRKFPVHLDEFFTKDDLIVRVVCLIMPDLIDPPKLLESRTKISTMNL